MGKKLLLFGGLAALGYYAFRVTRLASALHTCYPNSPRNPISEAVQSQGFMLPFIGAGALLAYKIF